MPCWLVVATVTHPHLAPGDEWTFARRVFGATPEHALQAMVRCLAAWGWRGRASVYAQVSAAQPHEAPLLHPSADFVPPPAPPPRYNLDSATGAPGDGQGLPRVAIAGQGQIVPPGAPGEALQALRQREAAAAEASKAQQRAEAEAARRARRDEASSRSRASQARADAIRGIPAVCCGLLVDRRQASLCQAHEPPHRDPILVPRAWPADLAFGPDVCASDEDAYPDDGQGYTDTRATVRYFAEWARIRKARREAGRC